MQSNAFETRRKNAHRSDDDEEDEEDDDDDEEDEDDEDDDEGRQWRPLKADKKEATPRRRDR